MHTTHSEPTSVPVPRHRPRRVRGGSWTQAATVIAILAVPVLAYSFDLPGADFQAGDPISAADVNDKLHALLDAANELDSTSAKLGQDASFAALTVDTISVVNPPEKTLTYWTHGAMVCDDGDCDATATQCFDSINHRPGCIVSGMTAVTRVTIPLDGIPDGTISEWGMHIGASNGGLANTWTCDLRFNADTVSSLSFVSNAVGQWSRFENVVGESIVVDNYADGPALGTGFAQGWRIHCVSSGTSGRLDFHQIYVRYTEG